MGKKLDHIFNVKQINKKIANKAKVTNAYFRLNQTFTHNTDFTDSPELIQEVADLIKKDSAQILKKLRYWKYKLLAQRREDAKKQ